MSMEEREMTSSKLKTIGTMATINARVANPTIGDKVALELANLGYTYETAGRIGLLYDQGVRDGRMPDAALVIGEQIERKIGN